MEEVVEKNATCATSGLICRTCSCAFGVLKNAPPRFPSIQHHRRLISPSPPPSVVSFCGFNALSSCREFATNHGLQTATRDVMLRELKWNARGANSLVKVNRADNRADRMDHSVAIY
ncbi:hypothetical protein ZHAS_00015843 [Anopheles sinensis]|uniref:Uncharacterized protein n=1 Tax=Anopheles sinensis TaxID=74873 RepID=A0A084WBW6_ANOSI|nr:hypothetical protein ZHAS_00015843 [Anopheles sinensis]